MPRRKQKDINDLVDDLINGVPTGNGHDIEGLIEAEESGEVDELIDQAEARRTARGRKAKSPEAAPKAEEEKPARRRRPSRKSESPAPEDVEQLRVPLLPLRDMVIFPHMVTSLFVGRDRSLKAIEAALNSDRTLVAVAQRDPEEEEVGPDGLHMMGVELVIGRSLKMP